ncbi:MAG: aspartyl-tRNA(Asn)/glutamyl-tRNA(Gln) amidotransferase subunit [Candidatus Sumerlaeota bacterium]|nr:aspartyl-tRNA(Asn)/glutamyl-tRNA(Gln) amidotransferase subunit [Candidatus Sumerlaeota bacterium]
MSFPTAHDLIARLEAGETTARQAAEASLATIERQNPQLNALLAVTAEQALADADAADARRQAGKPLSRLDGVPIAVKDNMCTRGVPTTCASRILENFRPPYDATAVRKLREAGAVLLGKANLDEFAMGSSNEFSAFGPARNPWNPECVPGGSSGGSAVAVASGMVPWSLGSDTGGSIRQPASFCGVVGMKPTYGRVSRYGLVAFASSLDQIGPFAQTVEDAALLLETIAGHDPLDSTSSTVDVPKYSETVRNGSLKGLKIGRPVEFFDVQGVDPEVTAALNAALDKAASEGAEIIDVHMPIATEYAVSAYYIIAAAEASSNLARYDGAHYGFRAPDTADIVEMFSKSRAQGFGAEVKRRIMLGTFVLSAETFDAYYVRAQKARTLIQRDYREALEKVDVIAAPTAPTAAFPLGSKLEDPVQMYLADIFTLSLNLAGYCGLSLPVGRTSAGLPIGLQLFGGAFEETRLLQAAWQVEQVVK